MVSFADFNTRGPHNWVVRKLRRARLAAAVLKRGGSRPALVFNVTPSGQFTGDAEDILHTIEDCLKRSERLYRQGNTVVFLQGGGHLAGSCSPTPIFVDGMVTETASAIVRNVLMCRQFKANSSGKGAKVDQPSEYEIQFAVPKAVLQQVAALDGFMVSIPEARYIINHPVFDKDFNWLDVGYHPAQCVLVCGESFEPAILEPVGRWGAIETVDDVLGRLPPLIRRWVEGFHWGGPVDLINYIGAALMTPLIPMLVADGHPGVMGWANKQGIGKTLACQCLATLKDGAPAGVTSVEGGSREVENQIASEMNDGRTVVFLDNQKGTINIPILEGIMTSKELAIRGFHVQRKVRRPNDLLWLLTTNDATPSDDLLSRCIHVRLHYEGDPDSREFKMSDGELLAYVHDNRAGILAELSGMVVRWLDAGSPTAAADSRFKVFGRVIGSVLAANGLPGFLSNTREEVRRNSARHQQLIALAERLIDSRPQGFVWEVDCPIEKADDEFKRRHPPAHLMQQKDWVHYLAAAGAIPASCDTPQKQKTAVTQYMNSQLKVPADVEVDGVTVRAMLVSRPLGQRRVAYVLAVEGLPPAPAVEAVDAVEAPADATAAPEATPRPSAEPSEASSAGPTDDLWGQG